MRTSHLRTQIMCLLGIEEKQSLRKQKMTLKCKIQSSQEILEVLFIKVINRKKKEMRNKKEILRWVLLKFQVTTFLEKEKK